MVASYEVGSESVGSLVMTSLDIDKNRVANSICSYHVCPWKKYFDTSELKEGEFIRLFNNKACMIHDIGMVILKIFDNYAFLICNVMIYFIALELNTRY